MNRLSLLPRERWAELAFVATIFVAAFAIRGYALGVLVPAPDELTYGSRAIQILASNWKWLPGMMWDQPPLQVYVLALVTAAVGASLDTLRLVSVLAGAISVVIVYFLGKSMYSKKAGVIASVAVAVDGFDILYSRQIYIEALATMLVLGALLLFWEGVVKQKSLKAALLGGIVFGLALDTKYIAMVMGVALVLFLVWYRNKFPSGFPGREALVYFGVALLAFLPVLVALALSNVNPFYFDLVDKFQLHHLGAVYVSLRSGSLLLTGFRNFVQVFFHVSSTAPFQAFPPLAIDIPIWTVLVGVVAAFFALAFLLRRNPREGLLFLLFLGFLAFAFTYPAKRTYFSLYPSLILLLMLGGLVDLSWGRLKGRIRWKRPEPYLAAFLISLTLGGVFLNAVAVPTTYQNGFGDWDEVTPIMNYIGTHQGNNTYLATTSLFLAFQVVASNLNVTIVYMVQPQSYYSEPLINRTLQTPLKGTYPIVWVISPVAVEKTKPEYILISNVEWQSTTMPFQQYVMQRYYEPLSTLHVLLFQLRPGNVTWSG